MRLISNLKRTGYAGAAIVLALAAVPIVPSGSAWATDLPADLALSADSNECYTIPMDKTVTLNLNGHTLNCGIVVEAGANLTINGGGAVTTSTAGSAAIYNKVGGTVTINGGTFNSTNWYTVKNLGTMIINDGSFTQGMSNSSNASMIANGWYNGKNGGASDQGNAYTGTVANLTINGGTFQHYTTTSTIKSDDYSRTVINGGTFTSTNGYLLQATGDVTVNDGNFTGYNSMIVYNATGEVPYESGKATINGGDINAKYIATGSTGILDITGGTFTGLERIIRDASSVIADDGIVGGSYNIVVDSLLADDKVMWKEADGTYTVGEVPDLSGVPSRMFTKVGEATAVAGLADEILEHSTVTVTRLGTFANGEITATGVGTFDIRIKPEVYKKDGDATVRDTSYDKNIKVHSYDFNSVNVVLPVGDDETLADDTVEVEETYDKYEYSVEDEAIATIDEDGKITAVAAGQTDVYATVSIKTIPAENVRVKIGTVYVYDFDSIEDTYLIKKDGKAKILADSTWDLTATTDAQNVDIVKSGNNFKINGLSAGLATVNFAATIGGEDKTKSTNVYVYEVNGQDVIVRKGETVSDSDIEALINKGHDDVTMRVKKIENGSGEVSNDSGLALTGVEAGESVVTYRLSVGANDAHANVPVTAHVWDFVTNDLEDVYDLGNVMSATNMFEVYDDGGTVTYTIEDEQGAETDKIRVDEYNGKYVSFSLNGASAGEYTVTFSDTVSGRVVATKEVKVRVHEIVTSNEDEQYIVMTRNIFGAGANRYDVNVTELNGFTRNRDITATVSGATSIGGVSVTYRHGGNWRITANTAGSYDITFSDEVASKTIHVYVMQFTFGQDSYHVKREDGEIVINAINNYWQDFNRNEGRVNTKLTIVNDENGEVVAETKYDYGMRELDDSDRYRFEWCDDESGCLEAGNYTISFEAYANGGDNNGGKTATKQVRLHIYEMDAPQEDLYIINTEDSLNIDVHDLNDRASTRAEIVSGPEGGLSFATSGWGWFSQTDYSTLNATLPGVYRVRYTDYMSNGAEVDTYEATVVVVEVESEELFVQRGETVNLAGSEAWYASFATDGMTGEDYTAEDGEIVFDTTRMDLGEHIVRIAHDFTEYDDGEFPPREMVKITAVVVYDVNGDETDDMEDNEDRAAVADFVAKHIGTMVETNSLDDDKVVLDYYDIDDLKDLLRSGAEIETRLEVELLDESEWEYAEAYDEVVLKIEDESGIVAMYRVYLVIYADGDDIGLVYELDDPITMRLEIPEEYRTAADGYTRTFSVIRGHMATDWSETAEQMEVTRDGDYLVFKNNKFSSFSITYTDVLNPVAPDTGFVTSEGGSVVSNNLVMAVVSILSAITLAGVAVFTKRK